jgi:hypothetical protein
MAEVETFDYVDLNEVDPTFKAVDPDFYTLKVIKAELVEKEYKEGNKKGVPAGTPMQYVKFRLAVQDSDKFRGRQIFPKPLFPNGYTMRALRLVMDATGIQQTAGQALKDWLGDLSLQQPEFRAFVNQVADSRGNLDANGNPVMDNDVDWRQVQPAV